MLQQLRNILIRFKFLKPSAKDIAAWQRSGDVIILEHTLTHGYYKARELAANALGELGNPSSVPVLFKAIDDNIKNVSIAALNALDAIGHQDDIGRSIINKRFNWIKKERERQEKIDANKGKSYKIYRWERSSKKSFDRVKEQLKKPIR